MLEILILFFSLELEFLYILIPDTNTTPTGSLFTEI